MYYCSNFHCKAFRWVVTWWYVIVVICGGVSIAVVWCRKNGAGTRDFLQVATLAGPLEKGQRVWLGGACQTTRSLLKRGGGSLPNYWNRLQNAGGNVYLTTKSL